MSGLGVGLEFGLGRAYSIDNPAKPVAYPGRGYLFQPSAASVCFEGKQSGVVLVPAQGIINLSWFNLFILLPSESADCLTTACVPTTRLPN